MRLPSMPAKNSDGEGCTSQQDQARLELLRAIAHEVRPVLGARDQLVQVAHHLAAVADAEREGVAARKNAANSSRARALNRIDLAQPSPAPSTSP